MKEVAVSISQVLHGGIQKLHSLGIDTSRLDAEVLLAHTLSVDRVALYRNPDSLLDANDQRRYAALLERRARREPVAYITGCKEFGALTFTLTHDVLIPRPETEMLLYETLSTAGLLLTRKDHLRILELGTGSGVLAVSIAKKLRSCTVFATDISTKKIAVARKNARLNEVNAGILFLVGDLFDPITINEENDKFDCIIFNPPYLSHDDWIQAQPEIKNFEPIDSLWGGHDGLAFYRSLIPEAGRFLQDGGYLLLEIGGTQAESITRMLSTAKVYRQVHVLQDLAGIDRVVSAHI